MEIWFWFALLVTTAVAAGLLGAFIAKGPANAEIERYRQDALRLPDAMDRAERAEAAVELLREANQQGTAREGALSATLEGANGRADMLERSFHEAQERLSTQYEELSRVRQELASAVASLDASRTQASQFAGERDKSVSEVAGLRNNLAQVMSQAAQFRAELDAANNSLAQTKAFLTDAEMKLRAAFIEAASKVFDEKSLALEQRIKESGEVSRQGFEATLKPFTEQVTSFHTRIESFANDHARDFAKFEGSVSIIQKLNQEMADATNSLARALKGNAKTRGDWGEMILETVLRASGLVEGANYTSQSATTDDESGKRRRPDVIINLPDGRKVVIDSKVSLVAWAEANGAETGEQYEEAMIRHSAALRQHIRDLAEKNYPKVIGPEALEMSIMFVPIEGALSAALATNNDLQMEAFSKRVVLASPNTLMSMLRVVERLWTRDRLQKQVDVIGTQAGRVLDSLIEFLAEFEMIHKQIERTDAAFLVAKNRLYDSPQSVINRTRRLVEAGAKGRKVIPELLQGINVESALPLVVEGADSDDQVSTEE